MLVPSARPQQELQLILRAETGLFLNIFAIKSMMLSNGNPPVFLYLRE
jgi:hypothetical protein